MLFMFDPKHLEFDFYCPRAQNCYSTSGGMFTWPMITANDSVIALPGVGISGGQTSLAGLFLCFGTNAPLVIKILRRGHSFAPTF